MDANLLNTIKALALRQKPLITVAAEAAPKAASFEPGQRFQGSVQAEVSHGMFRVRIGGQIVQMQLPASIRIGDTVALQVVATQPRLVFSMSASTNPLSTPEQLSSTSRLLSALSQQQPDKAYVRAAQKTPLWPLQQTPESGKLADLLRDALSNSGLFYESHQAQWLRGARSTAQLLQEPQNQPPAQTRSAAATAAAGSPDKGGQLVSSAPEDRLASIPEHLQPLVQQQLNALETRQMLWQGNIWPGQTMQWEIHEQAAQAPAADGERQWATQLQLNLPRLGPVAAMLRFGGNGLSVKLDVGTAAARAELGGASANLLAVLAENGITVTNMLVTQHAAAQ
ncbi:MAG: flagellar hook-length control protein FliK [Nitrosomonadales bacterium]|nr:flagellar hook-length control protein FliK [Nitrosomonadales bacterium]